MAIRTKKPLALNLSPLVWKLLVQEPVSRTDLEENDTLYAQSLRGIRDIHLAEITEANFHEVHSVSTQKFSHFFVDSVTQKLVLLFKQWLFFSGLVKKIQLKFYMSELKVILVK